MALTGDDANLGAADAPFRTVQQAVEAASAAGDAVIHILDAGPYVSTTINKTLKLAGANTTLAALTLSNSALIVAGTSGVSAPAVTVNAGSRAQDGVNLAAAGGTVALAAGTYPETLTLSRAVTVQGPASGPRAIIDPASGAAVQVTAGAGSTLAHVDLQGAATGVLVSGGSGLTLSGLNFASTVTAVSASVPVSATGNYWGDPSGPTHAANPGAAGYPVTDNVAFSPWCSNPAPACTPLRGPLAKLVFTTPPSNAAAAAALTPAVVVQAQDTFNNPVALYTGTITVSVGANPGASTLGGTLSQSANGTSGSAAFGNLSLNNPGLGYTLVAATAAPGGGVITATSTSFNIFNTPPAAVNDPAATLEDTAVNVDVLANDSDPNGDSLRIVSLLPPANGSVLTATAGVTYTPAANFFGTDVFTYTINDVYGSGVATGTVTVTVTGVNDPPTYNLAAAPAVNEDSGAYTNPAFASAIAAGPNETGQTVSFALTNTNNSLFSAQPALSAGGQLTFTPAANAFGSATVYVTASDNGGTANGGQNTAAVQTFVITVNAVNDAPAFTVPVTAVVALEDAGPVTQAGFATGMTATETGQTLNFLLSPTTPLSFTTQPAINAGTGDLTFQAAPNVFGVITVTARLQDNGGTGNGGVDTTAPLTFTLTLTPVPDPPAAGADATTITEDAALLNFNVLANDTDPDVQALTVTAVGTTGAGATTFTAGGVAFTPTADFNGAAVFTYTVSDPTARTATATLTVTVTPVNDPPQFTLTAPTLTRLEDSGAFSQSAANAIQPGPATAGDEAGQQLTFQVSHAFPLSFTVQPALDSAGTLSFTLAANAFGVVPLSVQLRDNGGGADTSASQTLTLTITAVNDAPDFANGGDQTAAEDAGAQTVAGWAAPLNPGPAELAQTLTFAVTNTQASLFSAPPAVNAAGDLTYTPAANANGAAQVFVSALDNGGTANGGVNQSITRTFTLTLTAVNDAPSFALAAGPTVLEDSGAFSQANFLTSLRSGPVTAADEAGQAVTVAVTNSVPALFAAQPALDGAGALTFTPAANANGSATVTVTAQDDGGVLNGGADTTAQTFVITLTPVADAPLASADVLTVTEDSGLGVLDVLLNDRTLDGGNLTVIGFSAAGHGALALAAPQLAYTPDADYFGADAFTYVITDAASHLTATTSAAVTILPVNDPPSFTKGMDITRPEDSAAVTFLNWATGLNAGPVNETGQALTFVVTTSAPALFAAQPTLDAADGSLSFAPAPNAFGSATVWVSAHDDGGTASGGVDTSAPQTFVITLTPANDPPTAAADHFQVAVNSAANALDVLANDSSAPDSGETLSLSAAGPALSGTVSIAPGGAGLLYTPAAEVSGTDTFTYTVADGQGGTAEAVVTVTIGQPASAVYLAAVWRDFVARPDLVGAFSLNPANPAAGQPVLITAVITNQGAAASGAFWVDFYVNPNPPPTAANQPWDRRCGLTPCVGIAWFVPGPLAPGQSVTLDSTATSYYGRNTVWSGALPSGANALYLYVDSWNCDPSTSACVADGAVLEGDETNNRFARTGLGPLETSADAAPLSASFSLDLPARPAQPAGE
ncbi:MAG: tandem-95 repeat protein [Anaerolineales bacterium]|nr:tandem-95 repeat protein [Anaerolineales bacterium]